MRKKMSIDSACDKPACAANFLPLSTVSVFRASAGILRKAQTAALSGMTFARRNVVFRSTKVA
jgi:hypothetical protein